MSRTRLAKRLHQESKKIRRTFFSHTITLVDTESPHAFFFLGCLCSLRSFRKISCQGLATCANNLMVFL